MCLAVPARVLELIDDETAVVELGGVRKTICIVLVPEARPGQYVIVHVGHAIGALDESEALATLALFAEMAGNGA
jgi:hydrogenase expression/formation protein HypC